MADGVESQFGGQLGHLARAAVGRDDGEVWAHGFKVQHRSLRIGVGAQAAVGHQQVLVAGQRQRELVLESRPPAMIYIGNTEPWRLHFESERARRLELLADVDEEFDPVPVHEVALQEGETEVALALRPRRRGTLRLHRLWFRWMSPLGLLRVIQSREVDETVY